MNITVRFQLRPPRPGHAHSNPHSLQCVLTVEGMRSDFGAVWPLDESGERLRVDPSRWRVSQQATNRRDDPVNDHLQALKSHILAIHRTQRLTGKPDLKSVRHELEHGRPPLWSPEHGWVYAQAPALPAAQASYFAAQLTEDTSLLVAYRTYVEGLRLKQNTPAGLSPVTLGRWEYGIRQLELYQVQTGQPLPAVGKLTVGWAKRYHGWLQLIGPNPDRIKPTSTAQAGRFLLKISDVLTWLLEEGWVVANPISAIKWPRPAEKEVRFLEPHHLHQLLALKWTGTAQSALWWFCLMCCTGLDYPDAIAYVQHPDRFNQKGPGGWKIVGRRAKPPHVAFDAPRLDLVPGLLANPPRPLDISPQCVNRKTGEIERVLGIDWRITAKTARKTFGCLMLAAGYDIAEVSRMLGHKSIRTTEKYYCRVTGNTVDRAMLKNPIENVMAIITLDQMRVENPPISRQ